MKIDKQLQKQLLQIVKKKASEIGFKTSGTSVYKKSDDNFFYVDYMLVNSEKIVFRIYIKKYSYDNIFWNVMKMEENLNKGDSLRAIGAFKAPALLINKGEIPLSEDVYSIAEMFTTEIISSIETLTIKNRLDEYIIMHMGLQDGEVLKCLAHIDRNDFSEAIKIAKNEINKGNTGEFQNGGKGFFELVIEFENTICKRWNV